MAGCKRDTGMGQLVTGVMLIVLGGAFILDYMGIVEIRQVGNFWRYWPLLIIALGVAHIFDRNASVFLVVTEILQGCLFLAITFHWKGLNWSHFAPLLLMTLGVAWIADALVRRSPAIETDTFEGDRS